MIGILLNDNGYEQDIRELLMAFYPGETFVHEEQDDQEHVRFYAEGEVNQERQVFSLSLRFPGASGLCARGSGAGGQKRVGSSQ